MDQDRCVVILDDGTRCTNPVDGLKSKGWCNAHTHRFRRFGDPTIGGPLQRKPGWAASELRRLASIETDECVEWEWTVHKAGGYPKVTVTIDGRKYRHGHVVVCIWAHGPKPSPKLEACHGRPDGTKCVSTRCVNPRHLRWDTRKGNDGDMDKHGTRHGRDQRLGRAKIREHVPEIRRRFVAGESRASLARAFDVTWPTIDDVVNYRSWPDD